MVKHDTLEDGKFPIWAAVELLDFGNISRLSAGLDDPVATEVANEFGGGGEIHEGCGVVQSPNNLRNHVAHQSRLWNFHYPQNPPSPQALLPDELMHLHDLEDYERSKLFTRLSVLIWLDGENKFNLDLKSRLFALLHTLTESEYIKFSSMSYSSTFQSSNLWSGFSHWDDK